MYKILVADDEEQIRKGIIAVINKAGGDLEILEAKDGEEALFIIDTQKPDIVLLDVRMPFIDGIEVLEKSCNMGSNSKFIIISGHSEFSYAQKALNLGAFGYILKPVDPEKLQEVLKLTINQIDQKKKIEMIGKEKEGLEKGAELLKIERTVNQLVHISEKLHEGKITFMEDTSLFSSESKYQLLLFHIDSCNFNIWDKRFLGIEKIKSDLRNILFKANKDEMAYIFDNQKNVQELFVLVVDSEKVGVSEKIDVFMNEAVKGIENELKLSITIAVSEVSKEIGKNLYEKLRNTLDFRFSKGINRLYKVDGTVSDKKKAISDEFLKLLKQAINKLEYDNIKTILKDIFGIGKTAQNDSSFNVRRAYIEVIGILNRICFDKGVDVTELSLEGDFSVDILGYLDNKIEIVNYLHTTIVNALEIESLETTKCSNVITMVIRYVEENYDRPLSVKDIAVQFAMNPNYFSSLFKKVTGNNFIEFINNRKIDAACRMLSLPNQSISGIAESLGFQDIQYFYKLFKKTKGVTPLEYRKSLIQL